MNMVDVIDRQILHELAQSGRASMSDIAERVHLSRASVYSRVRRMLDAGIIERFSVHVVPERVGLGTSAYVALTITQNSWREVRDGLSLVNGVDHVTLCSGDMDAIVLVRTTDNASLRDLVLHDIRSIPGVLTTRTIILLDELRNGGVPSAVAGTLHEQRQPVSSTVG